MRNIFVITGLFMTAGCSSNADLYQSADGKIVCELNTNAAFIVNYNAGDTSVVKRLKDYDALCNKGSVK